MLRCIHANILRCLCRDTNDGDQRCPITNKSKIVKREELIPPGKLDEGMIITFRYNSGSDKTPVVLVIYYDKRKK